MSNPKTVVDQAFLKLEEHLDAIEIRDAKVSAWSVGMQIHHSLLAANAILDTLISSEPGLRNPGKSILLAVILKVRKLPRGRGKSPDAALPADGVSREELERLLESARMKLSATEQTSSDAWWDHHIFGVMALKSALSFLGIHTEHHLSIIDDIRKA